jgi:hypothetical protein
MRARERPAWFWLTLWVSMLVVGFGFSPPSRPDTLAWVLRLLRGDWGGENPYVVAHFQLMGLWPLAFGLHLADRWRARPVPAWPFLLGSLALGMYALLPWFALPRRDPGPPGPRWARSPWGPRGLAATGLGFVGWALVTGDVRAYWDTVVSDGFVWPMTVDFVAFAAVYLLDGGLEDLRRPRTRDERSGTRDEPSA